MMLYHMSAGSCIVILERVWRLCGMGVMHGSSQLRNSAGPNVMR